MLPIRSDNYCYLIEWSDGLAVVDPGEARPVIEWVRSRDKPLHHVLLTHYHIDHTDGVDDVCRATGCESVVGPAVNRIASVTETIGDGDRVVVGPGEFLVMTTPGHTDADITLVSREGGFAFVGDTLFGGGCGRMFDGPPAVFQRSLQRLAAFPESTRIFCGHEYTCDNLRFSLSLPWRADAVTERLHQVEDGIRAGNPSIPFTIAGEKQTNPFLNLDDLDLRQVLNMESDIPVERVFGALRGRKDQF